MKIVVAGNYGAKNLGDEMILEGLLKSIRKIVPKAEITVLSGDPQETHKRHKVHCVNKFPAGIRSFFRFFLNANTIKAMRECDYFILGGGGLFGSLTFHANLIWGIQALWAYAFKKKVIMYGQSIGPITNGLNKYLLRRIFKGAKLITVRDAESITRLRRLRVRKPIHIMPDLAFNIEAGKAGKRKNYVLIALRQMDTLSLKFKKEIAGYINELYKLGIGIKIVNFQGGEEEDEYLTEEILELVLSKVVVEEISNIDDTKYAFKLFAEAKFALCMRLHSAITAINTETPFIAINYANKIEELLEYAGMKGQVMDIKNTDSDDLLAYTTMLQGDKKLITKMSNFKKRAKLLHLETEILLKEALQD